MKTKVLRSLATLMWIRQYHHQIEDPLMGIVFLSKETLLMEKQEAKYSC